VRSWSRRREAGPDVPALVEHHLEAGEPSGWFEPLYAAASPDATAVPWAALAPHPYVVDWLDAPVVAPPGRRALVVGCGLGDDAAVLARRGFEVTAIDVAPTAVRWARRRFRRDPITWLALDLLDPAARRPLEGGFDLVVEVHTVPYLPGVVRDAAMHAIGGLVAPRGVLVAVTFVATDAATTTTAEPPWPQAPSEFAAYRAAGLVRLALEHPPGDPAGTGVLEARLTWQRPAEGATASR
jgi:SAM-dependent methyltransferase